MKEMLTIFKGEGGPTFVEFPNTFMNPCLFIKRLPIAGAKWCMVSDLKIKGYKKIKFIMTQKKN